MMTTSKTRFLLQTVGNALALKEEDRIPFLKRELIDDEDLLNRALDLLDLCHDSKQSLEDFLDDLIEQITDFDTLFEEPEAQEIGPYRIITKLAEGGMGMIFLALQKHPIKRKVALKLIRDDLLSHSAHSRFINECRVLALLNHPNVATIYEGGYIGEQPFYTMEFFQGMTLDQFVTVHRPGLPERLEAFRQVCEGVAHAHLHGVIHRDIKPDNILLKRIPSGLEVKLIDFGIAKALDNLHTDHHTHHNQILGTPAYMSPEQVSPEGLGHDVRADVYGLGGVLYQLLCDVPPFTDHAHDSSMPASLLKQKVISNPTPPELISSTAKPVPQPLSWIVMKAMSRDPRDRYQSVQDLMRDVVRYQRQLPVRAAPPGWKYPVTQFFKRHRVGVVISLVLVGLVIGFTSLGVHYNLEQERQRRELSASQSRFNELEARFETVNEMLETILASPSPYRETISGDMTSFLNNILEKANKEGHFDIESLMGLRARIALTFIELGNYHRAREILEEVTDWYAENLGPAHERTLSLGERKAFVIMKTNKPSEAEATYAQLAQYMVQILPGDNRLLLKTHWGWATVLNRMGKRNEAEEIFRKTLTTQTTAFGKDDLDTLLSMRGLGSVYYQRGDWQRAYDFYLQALKGMETKLSSKHPETLASRENLALVLIEKKAYAEAEAMLQEVLKERTHLLTENHLYTLRTQGNLCMCYIRQNIWDLAEKACFLAYSGLQENFGMTHRDTQNSAANLADIYQKQERFADARSIYNLLLPSLAEVLGRDHQTTLLARNNFVALLIRMKRFEEAQWTAEEVLDDFRRKLGDEHMLTLVAQSTLAEVFLANRDTQAAYEELNALTEIMEKALSEDHFLRPIFRGLYGESLAAKGDYNKALTQLRQAYESLPKGEMIYRKRILATLLKIYENDPKMKVQWEKEWIRHQFHKM